MPAHDPSRDARRERRDAASGCGSTDGRWAIDAGLAWMTLLCRVGCPVWPVLRQSDPRDVLSGSGMPVRAKEWVGGMSLNGWLTWVGRNSSGPDTVGFWPAVAGLAAICRRSQSSPPGTYHLGPGDQIRIITTWRGPADRRIPRQRQWAPSRCRCSA